LRQSVVSGLRPRCGRKMASHLGWTRPVCGGDRGEETRYQEPW